MTTSRFFQLTALACVVVVLALAATTGTYASAMDRCGRYHNAMQCHRGGKVCSWCPGAAAPNPNSTVSGRCIDTRTDFCCNNATVCATHEKCCVAVPRGFHTARCYDPAKESCCSDSIDALTCPFKKDTKKTTCCALAGAIGNSVCCDEGKHCVMGGCCADVVENCGGARCCRSMCQGGHCLVPPAAAPKK